MPAAKRILLATIGSLGDLHPMLALALELQRRGHAVTLASTDFYRDKVRALGIEFRSMRPNWNPTDHSLIAQCENLKTGPEILFRRIILRHLRDTCDDLLAAAANADLMIAGELVYAAPLVAEKLTLPWVSAILSPCSFFSAHDPSVLVNAPALIHLRRLGWPVYRAALNAARLATRHWWSPVRQLRRELALSAQCDPVFRDKFSPLLVLALFSSQLAQPQPDWPPQTVQPGFLFFDRNAPGANQQPELTAFLAAGDAPLVFTLGSTAVHHPGNFYHASLAAAQKLGRRAILLGIEHSQTLPSVLALPYAPYSAIFPHAAVIVHQGGSGTTAQALRAGKPQLIVPYGWDQPDNAARVQRLGAGLSLARSRYSPESATSALDLLLQNPNFAATAAHLATRIQAEDALAVAGNQIERILSRNKS